MTEILFVTNRSLKRTTLARPPDFTDEALPQVVGSLWCGTVTIDGIDLANPDAGAIAQLTGLTKGGLSDTQKAAILRSPNDVLVFVHGAENSFADAVVRAAYNRAWLVDAIKKDIDVVAFTWPARNYGDLSKIVNDDVVYRHDQLEARKSAFHFGLFLQQLYELRPHLSASKRRLGLLCHSMGNYMLGGGIEAWFLNHAPEPLFDQVILAAADEPNDTFQRPKGERLSRLASLAKGITVYFNYEDFMMTLSQNVNLFMPLGFDGPPRKNDFQLFPTDSYQFVNCTNCNDYLGPNTQDRSHQYYRQSPTVRRDIGALLLGQMPSRLNCDPNQNEYFLFPMAIPDAIV